MVHRIDAETSGLVLVSKNGYAEYLLKEMFVKKEFVKKYKAIVEQELKEEIVSFSIENHRKQNFYLYL